MSADAVPPPDAVADPLSAMSEGRALARIAGETLPPGLAHLAHGAFGEALAKAVDYAQRSVSPRTEKAYADTWDIFRNWCAGHGAPYRFCVADIAGDELQIEPLQVEARTVGSRQRTHRKPFGNEFSGDGGSNQSCCPGDQSFCAAVHGVPCECGRESSIFTSKQPCEFHGKIKLRHSQ